MIRYYKLFDLLNRRGMKKSDLREFLAPSTIAKLSKGDFVNGEIIDKICLYLDCQPGDIMEVIKPSEMEVQNYSDIKSVKNDPNLTPKEKTDKLFNDGMNTGIKAEEKAESAIKKVFKK